MHELAMLDTWCLWTRMHVWCFALQHDLLLIVNRDACDVYDGYSCRLMYATLLARLRCCCAKAKSYMVHILNPHYHFQPRLEKHHSLPLSTPIAQWRKLNTWSCWSFSGLDSENYIFLSMCTHTLLRCVSLINCKSKLIKLVSFLVSLPNNQLHS